MIIRLDTGTRFSGDAVPVQAQALDIESDRELDVAEALFDLANVAVAFSEQADSAETRPPHDVPQRHHDKLRRSQVSHAFITAAI